MSEGLATITASYDQVSATASVTVLPPVSLVLEPSVSTIPLGGTVELTARVLDENGVAVPDPEFSIDWGGLCMGCWGGVLSAVKVGSATVDSDGTHFLVTGIARGQDSVYAFPVGMSGPTGIAMSVITVE